MPAVTLKEAVALTLGVEPQRFGGDLLPGLAKDFDTLGSEGLVTHFIGQRYELMRRQFDPGSVNNVIIPMIELKGWVIETGIELPPDFRRYILKGDYAVPDTQVKSISDHRARGMAMLIYAIAVAKFGYDKNKPRNSAVPQMMQIVDEMGLNLSEDSIRRYLKIGAEAASRKF